MPHPLISIRLHPIRDPISQLLSTELDADLLELYPNLGELQDPEPTKHGKYADEDMTFLIAFLTAPTTNMESEVIEDPSSATSNHQLTDDIHDSASCTTTTTTTTHPAAEPITDRSNERGAVEEIPIGCVALRPLNPSRSFLPPNPFEKVKELLRMYVRRGYRSLGVGAMLLRAVEAEAVGQLERIAAAAAAAATAAGDGDGKGGEKNTERERVMRLVLETGIRQQGAIRMYERGGWTRMKERWAEGVGRLQSDGGVTLCLEKVFRIGGSEEGGDGVEGEEGKEER